MSLFATMLLNIFITITSIACLIYCAIILWYRKLYLHVPLFNIDTSIEPNTSFSIIIPARNEEQNIEQCLATIVSQNYPINLFEVIVINDYSTDRTAAVVELYCNKYNNISLINLEHELQGKPLNAYKKKAIELAINKANGTYIVTTDADCLVPKNWLLNFNNYIHQTQKIFIAAPVIFTNNKSVLQHFQFIDFMALQATTVAVTNAGYHSMCNGANLCYNKNVFNSVGGFAGIDNIASGDDMLLMNKIKLHNKEGIGYLFNKESIVYTQPMPNIKNFLNQRIRWASKADKYDDKSLLPVLLVVYSFNVNILLLLLIGIFSIKIFLFGLLFLALKTLVEWSFMLPATQFFGKINFGLFALLQPLHIAYTVVAGWLGKFGTYSWKDRNVK